MTYRVGDRVLLTTTQGEVRATIVLSIEPVRWWTIYLVEPDADSTLPRVLARASHLRPLDEADVPLVVVQ